MKTEIPEFLLEMSKQINTQDNRCTADPIWQVMCKRTRVTAEDYSDRFQIIDIENEYHVVADSDEGCINEDIIKYLIDGDGMDFVINWAEREDDEIEEDCEKVDLFSNQFDSNYETLPSGFELIHVEEYEQIIKTCLTEYDANNFIRNNSHNYPHMYTFVDSMYRCPQMIALRKWIMELTK